MLFLPGGIVSYINPPPPPPPKKKNWLILILEEFWVCSLLDCKTVGFFLKISKEIGKVWRKSLTRARGASLTRP